MLSLVYFCIEILEINIYDRIFLIITDKISEMATELEKFTRVIARPRKASGKEPGSCPPDVKLAPRPIVKRAKPIRNKEYPSLVAGRIPPPGVYVATNSFVSGAPSYFSVASGHSPHVLPSRPPIRPPAAAPTPSAAGPDRFESLDSLEKMAADALLTVGRVPMA